MPRRSSAKFWIRHVGVRLLSLLFVVPLSFFLTLKFSPVVLLAWVVLNLIKGGAAPWSLYGLWVVFLLAWSIGFAWELMKAVELMWDFARAAMILTRDPSRPRTFEEAHSLISSVYDDRYPISPKRAIEAALREYA